MNRIGEINKNNQGLEMEIINYKNSKCIDIKFSDGTIVKNKRYEKFKDGGIFNPMFPNVYKVGFIGQGIYNYKNDTYVYKAWNHMLERCYDDKYKEKYKTYTNCKVCEEWLNFQNFAKWYYNNIWDNNIKFYLDKDILVKGNKLYSPKTCILVDAKINGLFTKCDKSRGKYVIGVSKNKKYNSYRAYINMDNVESTKYFKTELDAFHYYKQTKESYIKQIADRYKNKYTNFPQKLYDAMYSYEVEITD